MTRGISPGVVKTPSLNVDLRICRPGHDFSQAAPCKEGKDEEGYCTSDTPRDQNHNQSYNSIMHEMHPFVGMHLKIRDFTPECILLSNYISVVRKLSIAKIFQKSQFDTIASTPLLTVGSAMSYFRFRPYSSWPRTRSMRTDNTLART